MKKIIILLLNFFLLSQLSRSQEFCATVHGNTVKNYTSLSRLYNANIEEEEAICLNVYFHIVRNNDGSGGLAPYETNEIIVNLNNYYVQHHLSFIRIGQDFINNTDLNDIQWGSQQHSLIQINNIPNAINIYIVDNAFFNGWAETIPGKNLILRTDAALTNVSSHEIGHCLNLYHTHETQFGIENANNCSSAGDLICDTPPDSNIRVNGVTYVDNNCNYTKNDGYDPDTENIMSYTSPTCLRHFTNQQAVRMFDSVMNDPILQSVISCECTTPTLFGNSIICTNTSSIFKFVCGTATFSTSSNLQIINFSTNSITVQPINSAINGVGTIYATINGETIEKKIWIGKPRFHINEIPENSSWELNLADNEIQFQNITSVNWTKLSGSGIVTGYDFSAGVDGSPTRAWAITIKISVTNSCGTTELIKTYSNPDPDHNPHTERTINNTFVLYPNPTKDIINFEAVNPDKININSKIKGVLYDLTGILIYDFDISNKTVLNVENLNKGVYFLKIYIENQIENYQIIVE